MTVDSNVVQYLDVLLDVLLAVLPTLAGLAVLHPLGRSAADGFIRLWKWARQFVDERNDPLVVKLSKMTGKPADQILAELTQKIDKVAGILKV